MPETSHRVVEHELDARRLDVLVPNVHAGRRAAGRQLHHVHVVPDEALVAVALQVIRQHDLVLKRARVDAHIVTVERRDARLPAESSRKT
eukprot:4526202-Prymnesium_polylepis.3